MFSNSCPRNRFRVVCLPTFAFDDNRQPLEDQAVASLDVLVDDCLLRLFAEFRLAEQLVLLRAVCRRWRRLLETTTLASGAGPGTSVKLFGCSEAGNIRDYCRAVTATFSEDDQQEELAINGDELMVKAGLAAPNLLRPLYNQLSTVLPNLRQLTVWFERDSPFRELPALLEADGLHHLNRLTLLGQIRNFNPLSGEERFLERLCRALNGSQHHRKHLAQLDLLPVNLLRSREAVDLVVTELRDLLPRLTGLSLKLFGCRPELGPLLRLLSSGKEGLRLRSLRLESLFFFDGEELENDLLANRRLTASLEELRVSGVGRHFLRFIGGSGEHFSSLKRLSLGFSGLPQFEVLLLEELNTNLPHLTTLTLENVLLEMNLNLAELATLPAIRRLTLAGLDLGRFTFDQYRFLCILGVAFPGLEALTLRCVNSIDERDVVEAFAVGAAECFRHLKAEAVSLERDRWPRLAGRYEEDGNAAAAAVDANQ